MLEILGGVILALIAALGIQFGRSKNKEIAIERDKIEKINAALRSHEAARQAAEAARATANREYNAPIDVKYRKDFE